jgi:endonuclease III related protein
MDERLYEGMKEPRIEPPVIKSRGTMMPISKTGKQLMAMYRALYKAYGPQNWWPGDTSFEVMVGAVLTQNTAWINVEKAIKNLKREHLLSLARLRKVSPRRLAGLIQPSGYYNVKADRLINLMTFLSNRYGCRLGGMLRDDPSELRKGLLLVNGIGPETADSIILYAAGIPTFVVDAYTKRIFSRHGLVSERAGYDDVQQLFIGNLPRDTGLFNEYHALLVTVGKAHCKKGAPRCTACPLKSFPT